MAVKTETMIRLVASLAVMMGVFCGVGFVTPATAATVLVEAESFEKHGGWTLDTQFIREMGSPCLLAHGLGTPVADATTTVTIAEAGTWHVWVRTKD